MNKSLTSAKLNLLLVLVISFVQQIILNHSFAGEIFGLESATIDGPVNDVIELADGKFLLCGDFIEEKMLSLESDANSTGQIEPSIGEDVKQSEPEDAKSKSAEAEEAESLDFNRAVYVLEKIDENSILVGGEFTAYGDSSAGHIAKINARGEIDVEFLKAAGTGFDKPVHSLLYLENGKILVGGEFTSYDGQPVTYLVRLNADGSLDKTYDVDGPIYSIKWFKKKRSAVISGEFTKIGNFSYENFIIVHLGEL